MKPRRGRLAGALFLLCTLSTLLVAFGKNKVNLNSHDWQTIDGAHCRVYYHKPLRGMAERALRYAELLVLRYQRLLKHDLSQSVPIIIFPSHPDFEENNLSPGMIGEQTGGFTELLRCRIVLPAGGSWRQFTRVLAHEMVHAFQFDILFGRRGGAFGRLFIQTPPLWFLEGMAEYVSLGWDGTSEAVIRDAVLGNTLPSMGNLDKLAIHPKQYMMVYRQGQAFLRFLAEKFGEKVIPELMHAFRLTTKADQALRLATGYDLKELDEAFFHTLRARWWPRYTKHNPGSPSPEVRLTNHAEDGSSFNSLPAYSPDGKHYAFLSNPDFFPGIFLRETKDNKNVKRIAVSWRKGDYTGLLFQGNRITWAPDSKSLAFLTRVPEGYALSVHAVPSGRRLFFRRLPEGSVADPVFTPDGKGIVYIGSAGEGSRLRLHTLADGRDRILHTDLCELAGPRFTAEGQLLLLRQPDNRQQPAGLLLFDPLSRTVSAATNRYPALGALPGETTGFDLSGKLLVLRQETAEGGDLWLVRQGATNTSRLTRLPGYAGTPSLAPDGKNCLVSEYSGHGSNITRIPLPPDKSGAHGTNDAPAPGWGVNRLPGLDREADSFRGLVAPGLPVAYKPALKLDLITGILGFNSAAGARIIGMLAMSDMMGDRQLSLTLDLSLATGGSESGKSVLNAILNYYLLKGRIDLSVGLFRYASTMFVYDFQALINSAFTPVPDEDQGGAYLHLSYPLSRFNRFELFWSSLYFKKYFIDLDDHRSALKHVLSAAYTFDNTAWGYFGPLDGVRFRLLLEKGFNLPGEDWAYHKAEGDFRAYLRFFRRYALAFRFAGGIVRGRDSRYNPYELGGFYTVRGYPFFSIRGDTMLLANLELRFPLIDLLALGFPLPLRIANVHGVIFCDAGVAWYKDEAPVFWREDATGTKLVDLRMSYGVGFRFLLGPFRIRWDFAAPFDDYKPRPLKRWLGLFSLGVDF